MRELHEGRISLNIPDTGETDWEEMYHGGIQGFPNTPDIFKNMILSKLIPLEEKWSHQKNQTHYKTHPCSNKA